MQMQSGPTGINVPRIYNPVKQARDHDPHGHFVRRWLPALRQVPDTWLFEPWRMPEAMQLRLGLRPGIDLPLPPVDLDAATRLAKQRLFAQVFEKKSVGGMGKNRRVKLGLPQRVIVNVVKMSVCK